MPGLIPLVPGFNLPIPFHPRPPAVPSYAWAAQVAVKYVKFVAKKFNDAQIKEKVHVDSLYSQWCKDRMKQDEGLTMHISLHQCTDEGNTW